MKALLVIADGLSGRPNDCRGKTCLEAAHTPNLDELARRGITGLLDPIKPGVRPGSDTAHLSIFGYDPEEVYTGRGIFEAFGVGMDVRRGDICFRTNFGTIDENFIVLDRRAGRIQEEVGELEEALQNLESSHVNVKIFFKASTEHRGTLVLRGPGLSDSISDADPHKVGAKIPESKPEKAEKMAEKTAEVVNEQVKKSHEILKDLPLNERRKRNGKLPANVLLLRGASTTPALPSINKQYGIDGKVIGAGALYIGIARAIGLKFKPAEGVTGRADSPIINKAKLAVDELKKGADFTFVHMKGSDSCAHDHDAEAKISYIEKVDETVEYFLDNLDWEETHLAFTGDHTTPIVFGDHTSDPVPLVFNGPNVVRDDVTRFDERSVYRGGVGRISGRVVPILFGYNDWLRKYGA